MAMGVLRLLLVALLLSLSAPITTTTPQPPPPYSTFIPFSTLPASTATPSTPNSTPFPSCSPVNTPGAPDNPKTPPVNPNQFLFDDWTPAPPQISALFSHLSSFLSDTLLTFFSAFSADAQLNSTVTLSNFTAHTFTSNPNQSQPLSFVPYQIVLKPFVFIRNIIVAIPSIFSRSPQISHGKSTTTDTDTTPNKSPTTTERTAAAAAENLHAVIPTIVDAHNALLATSLRHLPFFKRVFSYVCKRHTVSIKHFFTDLRHISTKVSNENPVLEQSLLKFRDKFVTNAPNDISAHYEAADDFASAVVPPLPDDMPIKPIVDHTLSPSANVDADSVSNTTMTHTSSSLMLFNRDTIAASRARFHSRAFNLGNNLIDSASDAAYHLRYSVDTAKLFVWRECWRLTLQSAYYRPQNGTSFFESLKRFFRKVREIGFGSNFFSSATWYETINDLFGGTTAGYSEGIMERNFVWRVWKLAVGNILLHLFSLILEIAWLFWFAWEGLHTPGGLLTALSLVGLGVCLVRKRRHVTNDNESMQSLLYHLRRLEPSTTQNLDTLVRDDAPLETAKNVDSNDRGLGVPQRARRSSSKTGTTTTMRTAMTQRELRQQDLRSGSRHQVEADILRHRAVAAPGEGRLYTYQTRAATRRAAAAAGGGDGDGPMAQNAEVISVPSRSQTPSIISVTSTSESESADTTLRCTGAEKGGTGGGGGRGGVRLGSSGSLGVLQNELAHLTRAVQRQERKFRAAAKLQSAISHAMAIASDTDGDSTTADKENNRAPRTTVNRGGDGGVASQMGSARRRVMPAQPAPAVHRRGGPLRIADTNQGTGADATVRPVTPQEVKAARRQLRRMGNREAQEN